MQWEFFLSFFLLGGGGGYFLCLLLDVSRDQTLTPHCIVQAFTPKDCLPRLQFS